MEYPISIPNNQIWYTTIDGEIENPDLSNTDYKLVSNTYTFGYGILEFEEELEELPPSIFSNLPVMGIYYSKLKTIKLPDSIREIGHNAFSYSAYMEEAYLPLHLESIGDYAFFLCESLSRIKIPTHTFVGEEVFRLCKSLCEFDGEGRFLVRNNKLVGFAPYNCKEAVIPNTVNCISRFIFDNCDTLMKVSFPDDINSISEYAFQGCSNLIKVNLPQNLISIECNAFKDCISLKRIMLPNKTTNIEWFAFYGCSSLESIYIPENVNKIGNGILSGCINLNEITGKFSTEDKKYIILENEIKAISYNQNNCVLPKNATILGNYSFAFSDILENVEIHEGIKKIGKSAFYKCESIKSVIIPDSVACIENAAFAYCTVLENVYISKKCKTIHDLVFMGCSSLEHIELPQKIQKIKRHSFSECVSLKELKIPNMCNCIGDFSFEGCASLEYVLLPKSVTDIGNGAFMKCVKIRSFVFPINLKMFNGSVLLGCSLLDTVILPPLNSINMSIFSGCYNLKHILCKNKLLLEKIKKLSNNEYDKWYVAISNKMIEFKELNIEYSGYEDCFFYEMFVCIKPSEDVLIKKIQHLMF